MLRGNGLRDGGTQPAQFSDPRYRIGHFDAVLPKSKERLVFGPWSDFVRRRKNGLAISVHQTTRDEMSTGERLPSTTTIPVSVT